MALEWAYLIVFLLFASAYKFVRRKRRRLPPGPPALPFLGHIHLLGHLPHRSLSRLSKIYGPLMYLRLGSVPTLVASSPHVAKEVLKTHDLAFASRPETAAAMLTFYNRCDMAFTPYGSHWRQARKICVNQLFSPQRLNTFLNVREEEMDSLTRVLLESASQRKEVHIRLKVSAMASSMISRMVMNRRYFGEEGESSLKAVEFKEIFDEIFFLNGVFNIGDYMPYLKWLDLQGYEKRMKKVSKRFDVYLSAILEEHRRRDGRQNGEASDFIDFLLNLAEDSSKLETEITDDCMKGFVMNIYGGGTDTTSLTVEWALAELLKNPNAMKQARQELDEVVGVDRLVKESDITKLKYLNAIVKETMRLHPAVPLLLPHESIMDCNLLGYDIPTKTRVFVNVWAIGRDPTVWENADRFEPQRFLNEKRDVDVLPFGSGRRRCIGTSLGLCVIHLSLARLLHTFDWMLPSPLTPDDIDMSETFGLTVPKTQPLILIPHARFPIIEQHLKTS